MASASAKGSGQKVPLADSVLPTLSRAKVVGAVPSSQVLHLAVSLQPRFPAELQAFCDSVSNPASPNYRQFMTPEQVGEAFGASAADQQAVVSYLKSQGMKVTLVAKNRMAVLADATVAQAQAAFGVRIAQYQEWTGSASLTYFANSTPVMLPSSLSSTVFNITGLEDRTRPKRRSLLNPTLTRTLYNTAPSYGNNIRGQGRTMAISNFDGFRLSNLNLYYSTYGLPAPAGGVGSNVQVIVVGTGAGTGVAQGEGDLDIQMELGMAPLANMKIYDTTNDLIGLLTREANDNIADVISESYGWSLSVSQATSAHNQHLSMTAQGITYMCATGDDGTAGVNAGGGPNGAFDYPDYDPEVLQVGGTVATVNGSGVRSSEVAWPDGGGGWAVRAVSFNTHPVWQVGNGVPTGNNHRLLPDVGLHSSGATNNSVAAYTFVYNGSLNSGSVGTSFASPVCAGCLLTVVQRMAALNLSARFGRIQDLIYSQNGRSDIWFDIVSGSNGTLPDGSTSSAHTGWDFTTGWGAPNWDAFYNVISTRTVSGTVVLQGYTTSMAGLPITVQLYQAGTSTLVDTKNTTLNAAGGFTVTSQAAGGSYDIYVKVSHWLRKKVVNQIFSNSNLSGLVWTLPNGDVNGDNAITLGDFAQFRAAFGSAVGDSNYNANADLNGDGAVTLGDFAILRANFGQSGD